MLLKIISKLKENGIIFLDLLIFFFTPPLSLSERGKKGRKQYFAL